MPTGSFSRRFGFGVTEDLIGMRFQSRNHLYLTDQITGFFRGGGFNDATARANVILAEKVQEKAVEVLQQEVAATGRPQLSQAPRPGRAANRLEASILDERNRFVSPSGFIVGRTGWLEHESPAKLYFRIIEEGGMPYATSGFFFAPGGGPERPSGARDAIKLGQTLRTSKKPFMFAVSPTPAYEMTQRAAIWMASPAQQPLINDTYRTYLEAAGCPVPLKRGVVG